MSDLLKIFAQEAGDLIRMLGNGRTNDHWLEEEYVDDFASSCGHWESADCLFIVLSIDEYRVRMLSAETLREGYIPRTYFTKYNIEKI